MTAVAPNYGTTPETLENNELAVAVTEHEKLQSTKRSYELLPALIISLGGIAAAALLYVNSIAFLGDETKSHISFDIQEPAGNKPNFIFIVADDLSYNSIGYEPYDLAVSTPFLTKISDRGIRNLNYYGQEVCTPSRAALMTGRYPIHTGMQFQDVDNEDAWGLNLTETLFPKILRDNGYATYALGKWHLGHYSPRYLPTARGFDDYLGFVTGESFFWSKRVPGNQHFHDLLYMDQDCYHGYNGTDKGKYSTFLYRDKAIDIIHYHDYTERALFLYLAFQAVHDPYYDQKHFTDGIPKDYLDEDTWETIHRTVAGRKRRQYAMSLRLLDDAVSAIYTELDSVGQLDNSYIIFASDNGGCHTAGGRSGPLRGTKATLWEGGVKVDSFIYSPLIPESVQGTNYSGIMHVTDWFPTILDLAGVDYTAKSGYALDGVSQKDAWLHGESHNKREYLLYNFYYKVENYAFTEVQNAPLAVRNQKYKLIHAYTGTATAMWYNYDVELDDDGEITDCGTCDQYGALEGNYSYFLFDLESDPYETTNLYYNTDDDTAQDALTELYAKIDDYKESAVMCYGVQMTKKEAKVGWQDHGNYVSPWINETSLGDVNSFPSYCVSSGILSPSQKDVTDDLEYDDDLAADDYSENDWQDDDDDDYSYSSRRF